MEDSTAPAANGPRPEMAAVPPSQQRGQKRARGAQEHDAAAAAGGVVDDTRAAWFIRQVEVGVGQQDGDEEVRFASQLIDFLGVHLMNVDGDGEEAKAGSDQDPSTGTAAPLDEDGVVRALCNWPLPFLLPPPPPIRYDAVLAPAAASSRSSASPEDEDSRDAAADCGGAPAPNNANPSGGGPFGFDLNQQLLPPEDESFLLVDHCNAVVVDDCSSTAATAGVGVGSVEFAAPDDASATTVRRRPSSAGGLGFDLNEPACPSELLFPDSGAPDASDVPEPAPPTAPAEDNLVAQQPADADERPEITRRRRHLRLWDWAFEWANGLGWKRSRR